MSKESKGEKNKRKAEKRAAEKAASKVEAWKSSSKTVLGRLTCRLKDLPSFLIVRVEFQFQKAGDENIWPLVYSRKYRESAWAELFEGVFLDFENIVAINRTPDGSKENHLIIPLSSVTPALRNAIKCVDGQPREINLKTKFFKADKQKRPEQRPMRCLITGSFESRSTYEKEEDRKLYYKCLDLLIRSRHATMFPGSRDLRMTNELFTGIPDSETTLPGLMSVPITPLIEGCPPRTNSDSQPPSPTEDTQQIKKRLYSLRIRSHLSIDPKEKLLYMVFDLTCAPPTTYGNVYEVLLDVFGQQINEESIGRLQPIIRDLLLGLQVQRNYKHTKPKTTKESIEACSKSFPIREIVFNQDVDSRIKDFDGEEKDVYGYFKKHYNGGRDIEHQYLPLIGDERGSYFPMTKVKLPEKIQVFPKSADILSQPLRRKIHDLKLLGAEGKEGKEFMEMIGNEFWRLLTGRRQYVNIGKEVIPTDQTAKKIISTQQQVDAAPESVEQLGPQVGSNEQFEPPIEPEELLKKMGKKQNRWTANDLLNLAL